MLPHVRSFGYTFLLEHLQNLPAFAFLVLSRSTTLSLSLSRRALPSHSTSNAYYYHHTSAERALDRDCTLHITATRP